MLQEDVSGDAAAEAGGEREAECADDVVGVAAVLTGVQRAAGAGDSDAEEVQHGEESLRMNPAGDGGHLMSLVVED